MCSITANLYREIGTKGVVFGTYSKSTWVAMSRENELEKIMGRYSGMSEHETWGSDALCIEENENQDEHMCVCKRKEMRLMRRRLRKCIRDDEKEYFFSNCIALLYGNADNWNQSSSVHNSQTKGENNNNALGMAHQHASIFYIPRSSRRSQSHCSATGTGYCWGMLR